MNINIYTTYLNGGAGQAALRFASQFNKVNISHLVHTIDGNVPNINIQNHQKIIPSFSTRVFNKFFSNKQVKPSGKYEILTTHQTQYRVEQNNKNGIHHLHWIANFINWETFFSSLKNPLVWTLHDMNPFQGVFHYADDVINNPQLKNLEEETRRAKAKFFNSRKVDAIIISPSKWLLDISSNSLLFKNLPHFHINNGVDLSLFKPLNKEFCREFFNLDYSAPTLLFAADSISNRRKGFDFLQEIVPELNKLGIQLISIGKNPTDVKGVKYLGNIMDEKLMPLVYNACDAFVLPSREDNLPNTMVESMACGKPVISFKVGGMKDTIKEGLNGYFANEMRSEDLFDAIIRWNNSRSSTETQNEFNIKLIREFAEKEFDIIKQSEKYCKIYKSLS